MRVSTVGSPTATHEGRRYVFCSDFCLCSFVEDPIRYLYEEHVDEVVDDRAARAVAYFSMEIALHAGMHTYAGGLGVLAADLVRSAADLALPLVAVTLRSDDGYFRQTLAEAGQTEAPDPWPIVKFARRLPERVTVYVSGRPVRLAAWLHEVFGANGASVPVLLLDADLDGNAVEDRALTRRLYGGDARYRLAQEIVLGIGGVRMLEALGFSSIRRYHANEGHAALLAIELLQQRQADMGGALDFEWVRSRCVFTTHTPVPAGHDQFDWALAGDVLGDDVPLDVVKMLGGLEVLNMTHLALEMARYVNGVARRHGEVSRGLFPTHAVDAITNGVHATRWTAPALRDLYDRHIPAWRADPQALRHAVTLPANELWQAHVAAKDTLMGVLQTRAPGVFQRDAFTIGFARRATGYKRAELILSDPERLAAIASRAGPLQIVFAGKAHPNDDGGKAIIRAVRDVARKLRGRVAIAWLEGYDTDLAEHLTSGVDLWLNTPLPPLEASGTSGMKAALNGVPQLSVLDGWWVEGCIEGVTGWSIGAPSASDHEARSQELADLYGKLERVILPMFTGDRPRWLDVMRGAIAFNGSFFNSHRMVSQYAASAWL